MKAKRSSFRRPHHILARIICLFLAIIFWLYVMYVAAPPYDAEYKDIRVSVVESEFLNFTVREVAPIPSVRVMGSKMALAACDAEDIIATVSLSDLESVKNNLNTKESYSLAVTFKTPDGIMIDGEYTVSVRLEVKSGTP